jgi:hypothetical protein
MRQAMVSSATYPFAVATRKPPCGGQENTMPDDRMPRESHRFLQSYLELLRDCAEERGRHSPEEAGPAPAVSRPIPEEQAA